MCLGDLSDRGRHDLGTVLDRFSEVDLIPGSGGDLGIMDEASGGDIDEVNPNRL